jgi:hypothetical protein
VRVVCVVLLAACYRPTPPAGAPCSTTDLCPDPLQCVAGTCVERDVMIDAARGDAAIIRDDGTSNACPVPSMAAFSVPAVMASLSSAVGDGTPSMTEDRLELYFKSERTGVYDLYVSKRQSVSVGWPAPVGVAELNSLAAETGVEISPDGLTLWFASDRAGGLGGLDIYMTTRPTRQSAWSAPVHVPALSSSSLEEGIMVAPSGLVAYLQSDRRGLGRKEVFRAARTATSAPWSAPVLVDELADASGENPWVTADDCTIVYQSDRAGGLGSDDIWMATRPAPDQPFGVPTVVSSLSSTAYDADPQLTTDMNYALVVSLRGGPGSFDLFEAAR